MMKRKVYVVGGSDHYANWMEAKCVTAIEEADLVCFTGGEDVSPELYGEKAHITTQCNPKRDAYEYQMFSYAKQLGKHIIGICRGSQFLCVMNGGSLIQHQQNPFYYHNIELLDGKSILITSTHHQAQYPFRLPESDYKILGWTNGVSQFHYGETSEIELNPPKECEIVYYPKTKSLAIQGHPEAMTKEYKTIDYLQGLLDKFTRDAL